MTVIAWKIRVGVAGTCVMAALACVGAARQRPAWVGRQAEAVVGMARIHSDDGRHAVAVALCRRLVEDECSLGMSRLGLAAALFRGGELERAAELYGDLCRQDSESPVPLYNLAVVLLALGRTDEAHQEIENFRRRYAVELPWLGGSLALPTRMPK